MLQRNIRERQFTVCAKVSAISAENQDPTSPYYQIRDLRDGEKKSEIYLFYNRYFGQKRQNSTSHVACTSNKNY